MDELLVLFDDNPPEEDVDKTPPEGSSRQQAPDSSSDDGERGDSTNMAHPSVRRNFHKKTPDDLRASLSGNVDQRVGFRITKRLVSSADLLDMLTTNPFYTPASLSAMSLQQLNALLADPVPVVDKTSVAGKINAMTVGIVFSNTGTRIASSGSAFTIVTIGSLRTGPSVSLMLFGSAYGKFCKKAVPGISIAVMFPRLVPPKKDYSGDTSITFSLNDERQLRVLGTAQDFGFCKAKTRGKNERGVWVADARRCRNYVDTSVCEYCHTHRSQASGKNKAAAAAQARFQNLRQQLPPPHTRVETIPNGPRVMTMPSRRVSGSSLPVASGPSLGSVVSSRLPPNQTAPLPRRGILASTMGPAKLPRAGASKAVRPQDAAPQSLGIARNPYASKARPTSARPVVTPSTRRLPDKTNTRTSLDLAGLLTGKKRPPTQVSEKGAKSTKARVINTDMAGFDGCVPVPKPQGRMAAAAAPALAAPQHTDATQRKADKSAILERQREVAAKMQVNKTNDSGWQSKLKQKRKMDAPDQKPTALSTGWCAPIDDTERERLRNIRSRFASEAEAEKFAAARSRITQLEQVEERRGKDATTPPGGAGNHIRKTWRCLTCQRVHTHYPKRCYSDQHSVVLVREVREQASRDEKRSALSKKAAAEGGLKLGSGIEWEWSRFS